MAKKHTNKPKTKGLIKEGDRKGEGGGGWWCDALYRYSLRYINNVFA